jgi:hypothetical protein
MGVALIGANEKLRHLLAHRSQHALIVVMLFLETRVLLAKFLEGVVEARFDP